MVEAFKVGKEVLSTKDVSPIEVSKYFLGLKGKGCVECFSHEVKISFNFPKEDSITSLAKEHVVDSSMKKFSSSMKVVSSS